MTTDATVLVVAIVAGMLFSGGCLVVVGALILLHYVVHNRRVTEQNACFKKIRGLEADVVTQKNRILELESLLTSTMQRMISMAQIIAAEVPRHKDELTDMMNSLVKMFHEYAPTSSGIDIDANGDVTIGGSVVGRDRVKKVEYASRLGNVS